MSQSKRELIFAEVKARFASITQANGYRTDIGLKLTEWQRTPKEVDQLPGVDVRDEVEETVIETKASGVYERGLMITAIAETLEPDATASEARKCLADMIAAVGVDPTWGGLARRTLPVEDEVLVDEAGQRIGGARLMFRVEYSRKPWEA